MFDESVIVRCHVFKTFIYIFFFIVHGSKMRFHLTIAIIKLLNLITFDIGISVHVF